MSEYYKDLTNTTYPDEIDEIEHVSDISADTYELVNQYKTLVAAGKFEEASALLNEHPELSQCSINAEKWNQMADSLMAVEQYAKSKKLPIVVSETEPKNNELIVGGFWIQKTDYLCVIKQLTADGYVDIYRNDGFNTTTDSTKIGRIGDVGEGSVLFGRGCTASGTCSQAFGEFNSATGENSNVGGIYCTSKGLNSSVGGNSSTASENANNSIIHGEGLASKYKNQAVFGQYNDNKSGSLFEVGNGSDSSHKSNAFTIDKDGNATVKENLNARSLNVGINGVLSLGSISSENNISAKNNITAQGQLSAGNGAKINGGNCELGVGYDFITYEPPHDYEPARELRSIKYRTVDIEVDGGAEGYAWDSRNIINFNLDENTDIPSDATILGIIPLRRHPGERWDGCFINYEYLKDIPNGRGGTYRGICIWTNSNQNYNIALTVLYV